jgi:mRNA interferase MazF
MTSMMRFLLMKLQKGDVVLCQVPMPSSQFQQFKLRPAVIVSANDINQILDDVMVVPCTSNLNRSLTKRQYLITGNEVNLAGIRVESVVRCESIFTLNKSMIIRKLGNLSSEAMTHINNCLKIALSL